MKTIKKLTIAMLLSATLMPAMAQHIKGCPEELQESMREPVALYQDSWKQYTSSNDVRYLIDAYPYWKTVVEKCPSNGKNIYTRGVTIMEAKIKAATKDLVGLKIGIMGCIVNGPGEMADADYGYVGAGRGKISLYKAKECIEKNIPEEEAVERLIEFIRKDRG